jgi:hypothetical protein
MYTSENWGSSNLHHVESASDMEKLSDGCGFSLAFFLDS